MFVILVIIIALNFGLWLSSKYENLPCVVMNFLGLENPCQIENTQTTHSCGLSNTNIQSSYHHYRYTCIAQDCVVTHVNIAGIDVVIVFTVDGPVTMDWDWLEYHTTFIICTVRDTVVL